MKNNDELDFNFDDVPYRPAKVSSQANQRSVDRTAVNNSGKPAPQKRAAYRWGNVKAPDSMLTPEEIMHLNDRNATAPHNSRSIAPAENTGAVRGDNSGNIKLRWENEPKPEPVKDQRIPPSVEAQPSAPENGGFSSAAMEIMRRMQRMESGRSEEEPVQINPSAESKKEEVPSIVMHRSADSAEKSVKDGAAKANESDSPEILKYTAPEALEYSRSATAVTDNTDDVKPVGEVSPKTQSDDDDNLPVMPIHMVDSSERTPMHAVSAEQSRTAREIKAEQFELDRTAMTAGMDELEREISAEEASAPAISDGTKMFDAVTEADISQNTQADDATRHINIKDDYFSDRYYINGEDDEDESEEETQTIIDEYNSVDDAQSVAHDLLMRKRRLGIRSVVTFVLAVLLIAVTCGENLFPFGQTPYFIAVGVLLLLSVIVNISTFQSLISVFTLKPDVDFAPSFAVLAASAQTAVAAFMGAGDLTYTSMFAAAAVVCLAVNTVGKRLIVSRTFANFEMIANEEVKQAGTLIAPPESGSIADETKLGETLILGRRDTIDLKNFIAYSLSPDLYEKQSGRMSLVTLLASAVSFAAALLAGGSIVQSVSALAATACVAAQIAAVYPSSFMLSRICRKLRGKQVMLSGNKAADEISEANVIVLDSDELFRDESVKLYKFRTFGDYPPDDAFMTAAALTAEGHSPLAGMFAQISASYSGGVYKADSIIYENAMGLTGWVNERKTLLGNRMIMESHSIPVPPMEVDRKILQSGKFPVYLAVDNKIAAIFIVGYEADKQMLHRIRRLVNTGVTVLVRTVDPNVTADLVCSCYGLPSDSVMIMESDASHIYCSEMRPADSGAALLVAPTAEGFIDAYIDAYTVSKKSKTASISVIVMACIFMALSILLPAVGMGSIINIFSTFISYIATFVICAIILAFIG